MNNEQEFAALFEAIELAMKNGASGADALYAKSSSTGVTMRKGTLEELERSESADLGLRVFLGQQQAIVSTSTMDPPAIEQAVMRALAMAKEAPADPHCRLASKDEFLKGTPEDLDLFDDSERTVEELKEIAQIGEAAALEVNGVTNSDGGSASYGRAAVALLTSEGFFGTYRKSSFSISASAIAGDGAGMERDYDYSSKQHIEDLEGPEKIGRTAGQRAVARLNPKKTGTRSVPVVFDPRVGNSLLGHFAGAINGRSVARGTSFLKDSMDKVVFADAIRVIDDSRIKRGPRSKPFDGEGLVTERLALVEGGVLKSWVLDISAAMQLGLSSTAHASRSTSSRPGPSTSNLYIEAGTLARDDLIGAIDDGFYVTELIGMGVNAVTGDYSRGASGFWIEKGKLAYPVNGVTITSNLKDMFLNMSVADDLEFRFGTNVPTLRVDGMTLAGG
jgi:PmbA protein